MKIWRIENNKGQGPFRGDWYGRPYTLIMEVINHDLPETCTDCKFNVRNEMIVGCESLSQLNKWILPNGYKILKEMGYKITTREIKEILAYGQFQVVALP